MFEIHLSLSFGISQTRHATQVVGTLLYWTVQSAALRRKATGEGRYLARQRKVIQYKSQKYTQDTISPHTDVLTPLGKSPAVHPSINPDNNHIYSP